MHRWLASSILLLFVACSSRPTGIVEEDECTTDADCEEAGLADHACVDGLCEPPRWHFDRIKHDLGDMTLTDVYGRADGSVVIVGWYGTILTNRATRDNPRVGTWRTMASGTTEHLTGIYGVNNGQQFGLPADSAWRQDASWNGTVEGEMFAVGWNGTVLHYHPNPDGLAEPRPEDGRWQKIAGPGQGFTARVKIDPYCPDYDGDGVLDDGGGDPTTGGPDGWWSPSHTCVGAPAASGPGATTSCDDNCRTSPNGPYRPIVDLNGNFGDPTNPVNCLEPPPADGGDPANNQTDEDSDGVGTVCDDSLGEPAVTEFRPTLFDVWVGSNNTQLVVVAVGENGALVSYVGPNAAQTVVAPDLPVTDRNAWIAQEQIPFWYSNDCPFLGGADPDGSCPGSGRLSPRCPAQCNVFKNGSAFGGTGTCDCPVDAGQCCITGSGPELVGASCSGPGCTAGNISAVNGCGGVGGGGTAGECYDGCPDCFRRLDKTLRAITAHGNTLVAVGAAATVIYLDNGVTDPTGVWTHPHCGANTPPPLDERPILTAVSAAANGSFQAVGAAGAVVVINPAGGCDQTPLCGAPPAFLSGVFSLSTPSSVCSGTTRAFAVGDAGTFVELTDCGNDCLNAPPVVEIENDLDGNLNGIWAPYWNDGDGDRRRELIWFVGASGTIIHAGFYAGGALETLP